MTFWLHFVTELNDLVNKISFVIDIASLYY